MDNLQDPHVFDPEAGISLVEILVAMLLFAVLMLGLVPVFVQGLASTAKSASVTSASRIANDAVESARSGGAETCDAFKKMITDTFATTASDGRGTLTVVHTPVCAEKDKTVVYQVKVLQGSKTLADIKTEIWLDV